MNDAVNFGILGPIAIRGGDGVIHHPTGREARLLAALLVSVGKPVGANRLMEVVWNDNVPTSRETALYNVIYRLRRFLSSLGHDDVIGKRPHGYALTIDPSTVDAALFEMLVNNAGEKCEQARPRLIEALDLWRGDALEDSAAESQWLAAEANRLDALRWVAIERRIDCDLAGGRHRELIPELTSLTTEWPLRENLWACLMTALYLADQPGHALVVYRRARGFLVSELGMEPSRSVQELEAAILNHDHDRVLALSAAD